MQCHVDMVAMWSSNTTTCETFVQSSVIVRTCLYVLRLAEAFWESTVSPVQQMYLLMGGKGQNLRTSSGQVHQLALCDCGLVL